MVCVRLVDCPDSPEEHPPPPIPEMMFAVGEEPVGVRVLTYLTSGAINRIFNALEEEEVQIIRRSAFGKILEIVEKPVFSGRFARYMLSRQLKTKKKHEVWFRFAGKPIRFSLREFAIVTGLPCGRFPMKSKMNLKETISEKPYWPSLFGKVEVVTVAAVIKMLRRRTVEDRVVRIKFACLAILSSVLLPTNLKMKICREHAEAIQDLDHFFMYPWGRLAFDLLMVSIKERDEVALSQNNIAVKGFALALQLVIVEAVPSLTEVVQETCSSSEDDSEDEVEDISVNSKRKTLSPAHARNIDRQSDVIVRSIIDQDPLRPVDESNLVWSDDEEDEKVDNMVSLINTNFQFTSSMFVGGLTKLEVERMRECENVNSKGKKSKKHSLATSSTDPSYIASVVIEKIKPELQTVDGNIVEACRRVDAIEGSMVGLVQSVLAKFKDEMLESGENPTPTYNNQGLYGEAAGENGNESIAISAHSHNQERPDVHNKVHGPFLEMPSFSLGLTQEGPLERNHAVVTHDCVVHVPAFTDNVIEKMERPQLFRKSKRQKCFPPALVEDYECGPRVSSRARKNQNCIFSCGDINEIERKYGRLRNKINRDFFIKVDGISVCGKDLVVIPERTRLLRGKVVDILIRLVQSIIHQQFRGERHERYVFLDSKYVSAIGRTYPKFCKSKKKDSNVFPKGLLEMFTRTIDANIQPSRYYFPLNVGKKHWVGICVDRLCGKITVLDCNTSIFSDAIIENHLQPHLLMLPYLLRLSMQAFGSAEAEPFAVDRSKDISESKNPSDDGFMARAFCC
ncbi:PREDICTED: uncharacterized protein LOC106298085 [Brassica oleracea var. oleracea]|uniref:uncharacterized protein LOC106298085 n=1 Tax=Brassica oleracea var. oleracea TaxID=109376 RepID=UPI0006A70E73|nr:PREDICTED: uncharacterized protein LOC106298085 [Brassica oleracea var. oleracea]